MAIAFQNYLFTDAGVAVSGATVDLLARNTTTPVLDTTTTSAGGLWTFSYGTQGRYDVRITNGTSVRWHKYDAQLQLDTLEVANFRVRNPADTFEYDIVPAAITAARTLNLPLITGTDTLASLGLAATFSAAQTFSGGVIFTTTQVEVADDILFTLGNDNDGVLLNRSSILATNTALTGVMIGVPVTPAVAANSVIVSNVTASGDYLLALNNGGNSQAWQWVDSSAGTQTLYAAGVARWVLNATGGSFTGTISDLGTVTTVDINGGTVDGTNVGVTTAGSVRGTTLETTSGQIIFPAAQNASAGANTLDDYEEGSWTPSLGGDTTYNNQEGRYVKIGRNVFVNGILYVNVLGTGSTTVISGLPFTSNTSNAALAGSVGYFINLAVNVIALYIRPNANATTITFAKLSTDGGSVTNAPAIFGNTARVDFAFSYEASA